MEIPISIIERNLNAIQWVLGPYLDESILDKPPLMELAESYNELVDLLSIQYQHTFQKIEIL